MNTWPELLAGTWIPMPVGDAPTVAAAVDVLASCGVRGVAACASGGTPGDYAKLSEGDWQSAVACLAEAAGQELLIGVGHPSSEVGLERARRAAEFEPQALIAPLPDDLPPAQFEAWVVELAARAPECPLILAEGKDPAPWDLRPWNLGLLRSLTQMVPTLAGLALGRHGEDGPEALRGIEEQLALFVPGAEFATGYRHGAVASICEYGCLCPTGAARWFEQMEQDMPAALAFERRWQRFAEDRLRPLRARYRLDQAAVDEALAWAGTWWAGPPPATLPEEMVMDLADQARDAGLADV
jgi:4-hydroxy-tetrahydrodipicolinate synthase